MVEGLKVDVQTHRAAKFEAMQVPGGVAARLDALTQRLDALDARLAALEQARSATVGASGALGARPPPRSRRRPARDGGSARVDARCRRRRPPEYREGIELPAPWRQLAEPIQKLREFVRKSPKSDSPTTRSTGSARPITPTATTIAPILEFNEVLLRYPEGRQGARGAAAPGARVRRARRQGRCAPVLQKLVSEYGDSPEAERRRQKLAELSILAARHGALGAAMQSHPPSSHARVHRRFRVRRSPRSATSTACTAATRRSVAGRASGPGDRRRSRRHHVLPAPDGRACPGARAAGTRLAARAPGALPRRAASTSLSCSASRGRSRRSRRRHSSSATSCAAGTGERRRRAQRELRPGSRRQRRYARCRRAPSSASASRWSVR